MAFLDQAEGEGICLRERVVGVLSGQVGLVRSCDLLVRMTSAGDEGEGVRAATIRTAPGPKLLVSTGREPA